jgi:phospholipid/cholesterol/gamma-HCH transport system ATP-binding protein
MIRVKHLNKSFGSQQVLRDISAEFHRGKTNLIIGKSGSGKTVLVKCMVGLVKADSGSIFYDDADFNALNFKQRKALRTQIGMLFQGGALFDSLTVEQNVMFPLDMFTSMSSKEKRQRVDFCLDHVHLEGENGKYPAEISGGMKKRVGIARAIVLNPKYLFCDEPNSGLDPLTAIVIDKLIEEITKEFNMVTIINTHDMNSVMEIGENIIFLHEGCVQWTGTNKDMFNSNDPELNEFIFASSFLKKARSAIAGRP